MSYLDRLKQIDGGKNSHDTHDTEPPKPPKAPFVSFGSTDTGHIEKKIIDAFEARRKNPDTRQPGNVRTSDVFDWNALAKPEAFIALCDSIGVSLRVDPDGTLKATGNTKAAQPYIADIAARYRGAIIAHLLHLPLPEISDEQDRENIGANAQALDVTITEYCTAAGHTPEHRDKLLAVRRRMAPSLLVQNLCAFRCWLHEVRAREGLPANRQKTAR